MIRVENFACTVVFSVCGLDCCIPGMHLVIRTRFFMFFEDQKLYVWSCPSMTNGSPVDGP